MVLTNHFVAMSVHEEYTRSSAPQVELLNLDGIAV